MKYTVESLRQFGIQVAEKAGMSHQDAETLLKNLLFSDMRGVRSHGMTRLSGYVTRIERGCTSATAQPTITMDSGAVFSMDGNNGMTLLFGSGVDIIHQALGKDAVSHLQSCVIAVFRPGKL